MSKGRNAPAIAQLPIDPRYQRVARTARIHTTHPSTALLFVAPKPCRVRVCHVWRHATSAVPWIPRTESRTPHSAVADVLDPGLDERIGTPSRGAVPIRLESTVRRVLFPSTVRTVLESVRTASFRSCRSSCHVMPLRMLHLRASTLDITMHGPVVDHQTFSNIVVGLFCNSHSYLDGVQGKALKREGAPEAVVSTWL